jgi:hypothetical protein
VDQSVPVVCPEEPPDVDEPCEEQAAYPKPTDDGREVVVWVEAGV